MKKGKVFFHPIDGSGTLTISWSTSPKGDAIEAGSGAGVGFFSEHQLLCVIFDDVQRDGDHQILQFQHHRVEVTVQNGKVLHAVTSAMNGIPVRKTRRPKKPRVQKQ